MPITIQLQSNSHARDYVYEVSTLYLVARSIHTVVDLQLVTKIDKGINIDALTALYPDLDKDALCQLIDYLAALMIFALKNNSLSHTEVSLVMLQENKAFTVDAKTWCNSYAIDTYFNGEEAQRLLKNKVTISSTNNVLSIQGAEANEILFELSRAHIISRALRFATEVGLFEHIHKQATLPNGFNSNIVQLLMRYGFVNYDSSTQKYHLTSYGEVLLEQHPQSIKPAMLMIDERWWNAAGQFIVSFKKLGSSAFVAANGADFYSTYITKNDAKFFAGMASISLLENKDVADAIHSTEEKNAESHAFVDIGGGDGGLLHCLREADPNSKRRHILYEKEGQKEKQADLKTIIEKKYNQFSPEIFLGDFDKENSGIPTIDNACYIIKCCLHNYAEEKVVAILKNIKRAMGKNSQLIIAERVVPTRVQSIPHVNRSSNLLMRLLFKATSHDERFYRRSVTNADLEMKGEGMMAGNYWVMRVQPMLVLTAAVMVGTRATVQLVAADHKAGGCASMAADAKLAAVTHSVLALAGAAAASKATQSVVKVSVVTGQILFAIPVEPKGQNSVTEIVEQTSNAVNPASG